MSDDNGENVNGHESEAPAKPASSWLGRLLWLGPRVAEARAQNFGRSQSGFLWFEIARQICDDVAKIGDTGKGSWAVLLLE